MLAAVVPAQVVFTQRQRLTVVKDTLHVVNIGFFFINLGGREETGWRHLFAVAHHNQRLASCNGSHGLAGRHLRGLVEDDQVELLGFQVDVLGHTDRTHQHTRAESWQQSGYVVHNRADGVASSAVGDIAFQDTDLRTVSRGRRRRRHSCC